MLERHLEAPSPGKAVGFIAASLFGMAAHLMFLIALGALGVWAIAVLFRRPGGADPGPPYRSFRRSGHCRDALWRRRLE